MEDSHDSVPAARQQPSIPPSYPLRCCCGRLDCAYLQHNNAALEGLERDVATAAQLGQVRAVPVLPSSILLLLYIPLYQIDRFLSFLFPSFRSPRGPQALNASAVLSREEFFLFFTIPFFLCSLSPLVSPPSLGWSPPSWTCRRRFLPSVLESVLLFLSLFCHARFRFSVNSPHGVTNLLSPGFASPP